MVTIPQILSIPIIALDKDSCGAPENRFIAEKIALEEISGRALKRFTSLLNYYNLAF